MLGFYQFCVLWVFILEDINNWDYRVFMVEWSVNDKLEKGLQGRNLGITEVLYCIWLEGLNNATSFNQYNSCQGQVLLLR